MVTDLPATEWLTVPDLVDLLGLTPSKVRRLIEDHHLVATRRDGVLSVPAEFIRDGEPLTELRGTIMVLADNRYKDDEILEWLLSPNELLDATPIAALRAGRKAEVRRIAQAQDF
nr:Rv2175c family DNA-binding protein [Herbiconiux sp. VKM Ac-1786]